ncbi:MAG TPA: PspC domain-containing protein, partial [Saprospiraceae bacterium]|nr:PspC domain-containing protein [Saprospiraceae bacterium]
KNQSTTNNNEYRTGKKLYRDVDRKMIGGVCAGLAAYFGITNLSLFRVIVLIFATSGIVFFAYIMLWLIVPPATTVSERLEMQGEPVNVSNIARKVEQEITEIGRMISDISKDYKERKKSRKS